LLKSRLECPDFLEKLESAQVSVPQNLAGIYGTGFKYLEPAIVENPCIGVYLLGILKRNLLQFLWNQEDNNSSWDVVSEKDLWEGGNIASEEDYVLVSQDDIVDGIACFMAAYLISLKETK
ncbi:hypothetical protein Tco_1434492, partial [Tanacetum coccineum]